MINNRLVSEELTKVQKQLMQVVATNEILIKSNKRYEEKWQKLYYTLEFYKDFYHKYIDLITRGQISHTKSASAYTPKFPQIPRLGGKVFPELETDHDKLIKDFRRAQEENGKQVNISILEAQEDEEAPETLLGERRRKSSNIFQFSKDQCKVHLLNLAKDIYVSSNIQRTSVSKQMLEKLKFANEAEIRPCYKLKRSLSNPLEYTSERKELIFEIKGKNIMKLKNQQKDIRIMEDQEEVVSDNFDSSEGGVDNGNKNENEGRRNEKGRLRKIDAGDEMISFTVDPDDFNKNKMVEVSFISNNDILDQIKNN